MGRERLTGGVSMRSRERMEAVDTGYTWKHLRSRAAPSNALSGRGRARLKSGVMAPQGGGGHSSGFCLGRAVATPIPGQVQERPVH